MKNILRSIVLVFVLHSGFGFALKADAVYSMPLEAKEFPIGNHLEWQTILEFDVASFVVEKSIDGHNFYELGTLDGAGFSMVDNAYHFMDVGTFDPKNYYRLKEVGSDGTISYSLPTLVEKKMANNMNLMVLSKLECDTIFKLGVDVLKEGEMQCTLSELSGKKLQSFNVQAINGLNNIDFHLEDVLPGNYQVKISMGEEVETVVIRKMEDAKSSRPQVASTKKMEKKN